MRYWPNSLIMATIGNKTTVLIVTNYSVLVAQKVKPMKDATFKLLISTAPSHELAESLANQLVEEKLAACVNIIPQLTSVYAWQGKIEQENESLLLIKTKAENFKLIQEFLNKSHPYDVPELISCNIDEVSASYGQWLLSALDK